MPSLSESGKRRRKFSWLRRKNVVDDLNNNKQAMVVKAVHKMKERAQSCVAVGGGVFEGRKL